MTTPNIKDEKSEPAEPDATARLQQRCGKLAMALDESKRINIAQGGVIGVNWTFICDESAELLREVSAALAASTATVEQLREERDSCNRHAVLALHRAKQAEATVEQLRQENVKALVVVAELRTAMTDREPIRQMAEQWAKREPADTHEGWYQRELEQFGQAVAARTREACAQIAEQHINPDRLEQKTAEMIAAAIRASTPKEEARRIVSAHLEGL